MADKVKRNQFTTLLEKNMSAKVETFKLGCKLKFITCFVINIFYIIKSHL